MDSSVQIKKWISEDAMRMRALFIASSMGLSDWCLAAGFVRNLAWDKFHGYSRATALNNIYKVVCCEDVSGFMPLRKNPV